VAAAIEEAEGRGEFVQADVGDDESLDHLFRHIEATFGRLDAAFNNAGIAAAEGFIGETSPDVFDTIMRVNARGVWLCMHHEAKLMRRQGRGAIVNTASVHSRLGVTGNAAYVGSKQAVIGMTRSAALDLAPDGVRVNCVCPGATRTELLARAIDHLGGEEEVTSVVPMARVADPTELAAAALWLLSDEASYMTGHALVVDGGFTLQ
jgi:NAD(P)-dependent dehydrogenase (short-subunit alcohol dehydrogenase family)